MDILKIAAASGLRDEQLVKEIIVRFPNINICAY